MAGKGTSRAGRAAENRKNNIAHQIGRRGKCVIGSGNTCKKMTHKNASALHCSLPGKKSGR
jgi:hypothetical protein